MVLLCTMALGMTVFAAGNTKTMKNKKWVSGKGGEYIDTDKDGKLDYYKSNGTMYYKFQIPKQGYIMIDVKHSPLPGRQEYLNDYWDEYDEEDANAEEVVNMEILNAKKKNITELSTYDGDKKFSHALKKGTYYLAVSGDASYKLRYTFTPVTKISKTGKSFKKAVTIKKGAAIKNLIFPQEEVQEHFYKIKLNKKTKIVFACDSKIKGGYFPQLFVQMHVKKGKNYKQVNAKGKVVDVYAYEIEGKKNATYTLPKGTYYLRVWSMGSGYYTMKWK